MRAFPTSWPRRLSSLVGMGKRLELGRAWRGWALEEVGLVCWLWCEGKVTVEALSLEVTHWRTRTLKKTIV